jgi:prophage regulatory protein
MGETILPGQTALDESKDDRLLRLNEVLKLIPVCKSSWWKGIEAGIYPEPVKIGLRSVAWRYRDIKQLVERGVSLDKQRNRKPRGNGTVSNNARPSEASIKSRPNCVHRWRVSRRGARR